MCDRSSSPGEITNQNQRALLPHRHISILFSCSAETGNLCLTLKSDDVIVRRHTPRARLYIPRLGYMHHRTIDIDGYMYEHILRTTLLGMHGM